MSEKVPSKETASRLVEVEEDEYELLGLVRKMSGEIRVLQTQLPESYAEGGLAGVTLAGFRMLQKILNDPRTHIALHGSGPMTPVDPAHPEATKYILSILGDVTGMEHLDLRGEPGSERYRG